MLSGINIGKGYMSVAWHDRGGGVGATDGRTGCAGGTYLCRADQCNGEHGQFFADVAIGYAGGRESASCDWSVSGVQFSASQADTSGSPPANSDTDSISLPMHRDKLYRVFGGDAFIYAADYRLLANFDELQHDREGA